MIVYLCIIHYLSPHAVTSPRFDNACLGGECCWFSPTASVYSQCSSCDTFGDCTGCHSGYYLSGVGCSIIYSRVSIIIGAVAGGIVVITAIIFVVVYLCKAYYNRRPTVRVAPIRLQYPRDSSSVIPQTRDPPPMYPMVSTSQFGQQQQQQEQQQQQQQQQANAMSTVETQFAIPKYESPPPYYDEYTQGPGGSPIQSTPWQPQYPTMYSTYPQSNQPRGCDHTGYPRESRGPYPADPSAYRGPNQ